MSGKITKLKFKGTKRKAKDDGGKSGSGKKSEESTNHTDKATMFNDVSTQSVRDEWMLETGAGYSRNPNAHKEKFSKEELAPISGNETSGRSEPNEQLMVSKDQLKPMLRNEYEVNYEFGDAGSNWRMMKLRKLYRESKETGKPEDIIALERYGTLLDFDIAREEEKELKDRETYSHVPKYKPTGFFYHQREFATDESEKPLAKVEKAVDLNQLKAKMLKAKLQKSPEYDMLLAQYAELEKAELEKNSKQIGEPNSSGSAVLDLARQERLSKDNTDLIKQSVLAILKDKKFSADLDEQDEKLSGLQKNLQSGKLKLTSDVSLMSKLSRELDRCQLCLDNNKPIPIVHQSDNFVLSLAPQPSIVPHALMLYPKEHYLNSLQFEVEEKDEFRRVMACLSRFYYKKYQQKCIFYENSVKGHCHIMVVPLPTKISDSLIYDHFRSGIIEESNDLDQQHRIVLDTRSRSYDNFISPEAPFFHLWLDQSGGIGHIIEEDTWPANDLFARRVIGGVLRLDKFDVERKTRFYGSAESTEPELQEMKHKFEGFTW